MPGGFRYGPYIALYAEDRDTSSVVHRHTLTQSLTQTHLDPQPPTNPVGHLDPCHLYTEK